MNRKMFVGIASAGFAVVLASCSGAVVQTESKNGEHSASKTNAKTIVPRGDGSGLSDVICVDNTTEVDSSVQVAADLVCIQQESLGGNWRSALPAGAVDLTFSVLSQGVLAFGTCSRTSSAFELIGTNPGDLQLFWRTNDFMPSQITGGTPVDDRGRFYVDYPFPPSQNGNAYSKYYGRIFGDKLFVTADWGVVVILPRFDGHPVRGDNASRSGHGETEAKAIYGRV